MHSFRVACVVFQGVQKTFLLANPEPHILSCFHAGVAEHRGRLCVDPGYLAMTVDSAMSSHVGTGGGPPLLAWKACKMFLAGFSHASASG